MLSKLNIMDFINPESFMSGGCEGESKISNPIYIYKVYVNDGREELVRSAKFSGVQINVFKNIIALSDKQVGYNTFISKSDGQFDFMSGFTNPLPASFIMPNSLLFEEMEVLKDKKAYSKLPIVSNPVYKILYLLTNESINTLAYFHIFKFLTRAQQSVGQRIGRASAGGAGHDPLGDPPEVFDQHDPQCDGYGPKLSDG